MSGVCTRVSKKADKLRSFCTRMKKGDKRVKAADLSACTLHAGTAKRLARDGACDRALIQLRIATAFARSGVSQKPAPDAWVMHGLRIVGP